MEIRQSLDALAGTSRCQCEAQAKWRNDPHAPTQLCIGATGVEQRFGKHPLELIRDHAKLSMIHRGLLSWYSKPHAQEEFRMDHHKNPQENQTLKSTYLCSRIVLTAKMPMQDHPRVEKILFGRLILSNSTSLR